MASKICVSVVIGMFSYSYHVLHSFSDGLLVCHPTVTICVACHTQSPSPDFEPQDSVNKTTRLLTTPTKTCVEQGLIHATPKGELNSCYFTEAISFGLSTTDDGKKVAIKQISRVSVDQYVVHREVSDLTWLNSPYLTPLMESFMDPHNFIIIQGLAAGGTLQRPSQRSCPTCMKAT